jgi:hypothetical protein
MPPRHSKFRFRQFSLRTGLLVFIALSIAFGLATNWYRQVRAQGDLQKAFFAKCQLAEQGWSPPFTTIYANEAQVGLWTYFVRTWVHPEYGRKFQRVSLSADQFESLSNPGVRRLFSGTEVWAHNLPHATLAPLFGLPGIRELHLHSTHGAYTADEANLKHPVTDWSIVRGAQDLQELTFTGDAIDDSLCQELGRLPSLETLYFTECSIEGMALLAKSRSLKSLKILVIRIPDQTRQEMYPHRKSLRAALADLAANTALEELTLDWIPAESEDIAEFCRQSRVKKLEMSVYEYSKESLAKLATLPNLEHLKLRGIKDDRLLALQEAKNLQTLAIESYVPNEIFATLTKKLPNCRVTRKYSSWLEEQFGL